MSGEATTIARPYAEAAFARAVETEKLELWSDMLGFLASVARDPVMAELIANPQRLGRDQLLELLLGIGGGRLSDEGQNLVRLLVQNDRLPVLAEIQELFNSLKSAHEGALDVVITAAFAVKPAEEQRLAAALQRRLGRDVRITTREDPTLIGGVKIRAGDMVIDGSVSGQLSQLATELGI